MKRINLRMKEQQTYDIIKSLVDHDGNKNAAALKLGCTVRTVNRLILKYKQGGKEAFLHGNRGRKPAHALSDAAKANILNLYNSKYFDATFSYACELMAEHDGVSISPTTLTNLLYEHFITSPRTTKAVRKKLTKELHRQQKETTSTKSFHELQTSIVAIEQAHSRRPRCAYFGEMLQMDASLHLWYGQEKSQLHIAIDDSTGALVGAYFDEQETLNGYYHLFYQILTQYGIPAMFYTDRRTVFEYRASGSNQVENDTLTQFGYACKQLGVELKTTSIAQAKGRVERAFQTLQQRLPIALRLAGITTKDKANAFLNSYIKKYNAKFALPIKHSKSVFEKQPEIETIHNTLAVLTERTVDAGHCIKFQKEFYKTMDSRGLQVHHLQGTKGLVIRTFDKRLLFSTGKNIYELDVLPEQETKSKEFDFAPAEKPKKRRIPAASHPWRSETFLKFKMHSITGAMKVC